MCIRDSSKAAVPGAEDIIITAVPAKTIGTAAVPAEITGITGIGEETAQ